MATKSVNAQKDLDLSRATENVTALTDRNRELTEQLADIALDLDKEKSNSLALERKFKAFGKERTALVEIDGVSMVHVELTGLWTAADLRMIHGPLLREIKLNLRKIQAEQVEKLANKQNKTNKG